MTLAKHKPPRTKSAIFCASACWTAGLSDIQKPELAISIQISKIIILYQNSERTVEDGLPEAQNCEFIQRPRQLLQQAGNSLNTLDETTANNDRKVELCMKSREACSPSHESPCLWRSVDEWVVARQIDGKPVHKRNTWEIKE